VSEPRVGQHRPSERAQGADIERVVLEGTRERGDPGGTVGQRRGASLRGRELDARLELEPHEPRHRLRRLLDHQPLQLLMLGEVRAHLVAEIERVRSIPRGCRV
jgi:hypothetical protein